MNHSLHLSKDLNILLTLVESLVFLFRPSARDFSKSLSGGRILFVAPHFQSRLPLTDGIDHSELVILSSHLTGAALK